MIKFGARWRELVNFMPRPLYPMQVAPCAYWVGGPVDHKTNMDNSNSSTGKKFSVRRNLQTGSGVHPTFYSMGSAVRSSAASSHNVKSATHLLPSSRLIMSGVRVPTALYVFMLCIANLYGHIYIFFFIWPRIILKCKASTREKCFNKVEILFKVWRCATLQN